MENEHTTKTLYQLRKEQEAFKDRKSFADGSGDKEAIKTWAKKINTEKTPSQTQKVFGDLVKKFNLVQEEVETISYEEGRKLLWSIMKAYAVSYPAKFRDGVFVVDNGNKILIQNLLKYFLGQGGAFENYKGLFLTGIPGVGKTIPMEIFQRFSQCEGTLHRFKIFSAVDIYNDYTEAGRAFLNHLSKENICIDDLGTEPPVYKEYGNEIKPLLDLLELRHKQSLVNPNLRTFITSNLSVDEIAERYGPRIKDRFKNYNVITVKGESRR